MFRMNYQGAHRHVTESKHSVMNKQCVCGTYDGHYLNSNLQNCKFRY